MAKFYEAIGFAEQKETSPGVWQDVIIERQYKGDVTKIIKKYIGWENQNDNIDISNTISIVADQYAYDCLANIRYVKWMGSRWKISSIEVDRPRLTLTIGGVYNGPEPTS